MAKNQNPNPEKTAKMTKRNLEVLLTILDNQSAFNADRRGIYVVESEVTEIRQAVAKALGLRV